MTAVRDTPIVVTVIQKPNGRYRTRITRNGTAYGRDRAFDTQAAEGDERIRTAVPSLGADFSYVALAEGSLPDVLLAKLLGERAGAKS